MAIGDVLALLREEFPDVTISKIRFLESRGLLVPERTPSGYRKFYESDIERLRWILRQQREHFLPLKVIKGRLEKGMTDEEAPVQPLFQMGEPPPELEPETVLVGASGARELAQAAAAALAAVGAIDVVHASNSVPEMAETSMAAGHETAGHAQRAKAAGATRSRSVEARETRPPTSVPEPGVAAATKAEQPRHQRRPNAEPAPDAVSPSAADLGSVGTAATRGGHQSEVTTAPRVPTRSTSGLPGAGLSGASLTVGELANASGLDVEGVEELESFGLIAGRTVAGAHCYDESAVLVARLAAGFARHGIEARHLRIFKHASDRQTGLFAQVVTPLLKQRNPEARARAIEDLAELSELGEALMRCFYQATLRDLTGG